MMISRDKSPTGVPFTLIKRSPGNRPVAPPPAPGSAKITGRKMGDISDSVRSKQMALRRLNPKSCRGDFCRLMTSCLGGGSCTSWTGGNGSCTSSKACTRAQRSMPCDSPTGLSENGGVAKEEFVVSVRLSALGDGDVSTCKWAACVGVCGAP